MHKIFISAIAAAALLAAPTFASAQDHGAGAASGAAAGAVAGAIVGGPVGAAVGAGVGGTMGAASEDHRRGETVVIERDHPVRKRTCVETHDRTSCVETHR